LAVERRDRVLDADVPEAGSGEALVDDALPAESIAARTVMYFAFAWNSGNTE